VGRADRYSAIQGSMGEEVDAEKLMFFERLDDHEMRNERAAVLKRLSISSLPSTGTPLDASPREIEGHMGKAVLDYFKGNLMGEPPEGKWFERTGKEGPSLYAEPKINWEMGEVDGFHGGGVFRKFSDKYMKSGTGGHVFGWGHYVSEEKGVGKYYAELYQKEKGAPDMFRTSVRGKTDWLGKQPEWLRNEVADLYRNNVPVSEWADFLKGRKEAFSRSIKVNQERLKTSTQPWIEEANIENAKQALKPMDDLIGDLKKGVVKKAEGSNVAGQYKVKLFKGKSPDEYTFLDWDKPMPKADIAKIKAQAQKEGILDEIENMGGLNIQAEHSGEALYKTLTLALDEKEAASKFLDRAGISGIRYPVGSLSGPQRRTYLLSGEKLPQQAGVIARWARDKTLSDDTFKEILDREIGRIENIHKYGVYSDLEEGVRKSLVKKLRSAKRSDFGVEELKKNYVIFDPKNIEIMEGPGYHHLLKPGYPKGNK